MDHCLRQRIQVVQIQRKSVSDTVQFLQQLFLMQSKYPATLNERLKEKENTCPAQSICTRCQECVSHLYISQIINSAIGGMAQIDKQSGQKLDKSSMSQSKLEYHTYVVPSTEKNQNDPYAAPPVTQVLSLGETITLKSHRIQPS